MSETRPTFEPTDSSGAAPVRPPARQGGAGPADFQDAARLLLGLALAVAPLIAMVALQQSFELPGTLVGIVVLFSVLLMVGVTMLLRPRTRWIDSPASSADYLAGATTAVAPAAPAGDAPEGFFSSDPLTGLLTFQPFSQRLLEEFHRVKRTEECAALVLVDVNHLAQINEQFGVEAGDQVLRRVSACLELSKRVSDVLARMGDDEFALLLLDCDRAGARAFIERAQELLARESIPVQVEGGSTSVWIGICAGVAICDARTGDADDVLTAAVDDLNAAREARDRRRERWREAA